MARGSSYRLGGKEDTRHRESLHVECGYVQRSKHARGARMVRGARTRGTNQSTNTEEKRGRRGEAHDPRERFILKVAGE